MTQYTADDLKIIADPVAWVRSKPAIFFRTAQPDPLELCRLLVRDALVSGAPGVEICIRPPWWVVGSELDWLALSRRTVDDLFSRLIAFPEAGQNESRSEIIVAAFASSVATTSTGEEQIFGSDLALEVAKEFMSRRSEWRRCIAFSMPQSP